MLLSGLYCRSGAAAPLPQRGRTGWVTPESTVSAPPPLVAPGAPAPRLLAHLSNLPLLPVTCLVRARALLRGLWDVCSLSRAGFAGAL